MASKIIFWFSLGFTIYVYAGYPLLAWLLARLIPCRIRKAVVTPRVSLLIAAYNEADVIAAKVRNAIALDYPVEKLEVVIASDGSTDATVDIVRSLLQGGAVAHVHLLAFRNNRGKVAVLNACIPQLRGEIVVFSDASSLMRRNSIRKLVANFNDPRVGAVSGVYKVLNHQHSKFGAQEDFYWKYETFLKLQEAKLGCLHGAHGSLYAIRKELYPFPDPHTINDDFVIPTAAICRGFIIAYEPEAEASEEAHEMEGFRRRVRIMAGNVEQLSLIRHFFRPFRPMMLFCFLSHKGARVLLPLAMTALAITNVVIRKSPLYAGLGWAQAAFYGFALIGFAVPLRPALLRVPSYCCRANLALFGWIYNCVRFRRLVPARSDLDGVESQR
jgi:cellulose synthase/poly-beta-1,6-N-acetylglucosamine synthase-like glycosyltransferase